MSLFEIDWNQMWTTVAHLAVAFVLAIPIGLDRELHSKAGGFRTFPLVAIASCGFMLIGIQVLPDWGARARVMQGLITGIGFIGGGAILKDHKSVMGLATATSIWNTGAIGVAVAWSRLEIAVFLSLINFLTLRYVYPIKKKVEENADQLKADEAD